jgi:hypothetical protein
MKITAFWDIVPCSIEQLTSVSEVLTASIFTLMMEAVNTSEMSVNLYETTQRNIPEGCDLHTCHHENLKSHFI